MNSQNHCPLLFEKVWKLWSAKGCLWIGTWGVRGTLLRHFRLEVGILVLNCWFYKSAYEPDVSWSCCQGGLFQEILVCLPCCPLTVSFRVLFFSHLYCSRLMGCFSPSDETTSVFTQIKLIKSSHIFYLRRRHYCICELGGSLLVQQNFRRLAEKVVFSLS